MIDLGTDVKAEKFVAAVEANPGAIVCLSALLTTTMVNMEKIGKAVKEAVPGTIVAIGELLLPWILATKLVWMFIRLTHKDLLIILEI